MAAIVILGILALLFVISVLVAVFGSNETTYDSDVAVSTGGVIAAVVFGIIFGVVWIACSFSPTPARNVGIEIEFGKATDTLTPGLNWVAPWASVENFPTTSQVLDMDATDNTDASKANPVQVKFKGGGSGAVNVNMNY